ncbi:16S rRNA (uracil(1498)-N(3))-methyltransferase [Flavobacteriaceae bacterium]|uniref:16S rRNA (uracil(1498)-N(3))-methyltransferase n=1 Tax=Candidatus Arcticimaribacter forsetii TaxID=2820661 RepID=UPI00207777FF|nr:16S rRNA (uracil(1498)-N(3))-methyltransferase [Candidatus Arcticimaribacter forsetii]MDA8699346.1 16S rRNA (uracil(1498)-N(3))-methyltransferase [Flavobacteriaceae bacterium]MDB2329739.1 16S rRNA (uracil(1498)-N(3))-methyltransferase [Flavobacteriaceae bacterium]MDB2345456.1 16S rRNA (uracil(1498)-N(3))-methyltransferase [Flavobacteriaceae bacterium]MDB4674290.1 16S rRNA (uracil(1498)-N(3))-methyltransferase [Flavobacteriaceae bacterium]
MDLFFHTSIDTKDSLLSFSDEESRHLSKVLRKQPGDVVAVTDGKGTEVRVEIQNISPRKSSGLITETILHPSPKHKTHIAIAPTKNIVRLEWFLEKATEIGIHRITPILCKHSERKMIKNERLNKIIQAALKQSQQFHLPKLDELRTLESFIEEQNGGYIAHCNPGTKQELADLKSIENSTCILIGPEGDFSVDEVTFAEKNNFKPVSLGKQRLRTETAAIVACHTLALIHRNL